MQEYVIGIMVLSFIVDILLLMGAGKLTSHPMCWAGMFVAALLSAVYHALCIMPHLGQLNHLTIRLLVMGGMGAITFGWSKTFLRPMITFIVLQMALNGLVSGAEMGNVWPVLFGGLALWLMCIFGCPKTDGRIIPAELSHDGNTVKIHALVDTGNMLKDPVTGESVLVVCNKLGAILAGLTERQIADPIQTILERPNHRFRLLPYHTVGQKNGMMLAMKIDQVKLQGKKTGNLIAFAPYGLGLQKEYQALVGGV